MLPTLTPDGSPALAATFCANGEEGVIPFAIDGLESLSEYKSEIWVYIPQDEDPISIRLSMHGFRSIKESRVDIRLKSDWQLLTAISQIPENHQRAVLRLSVVAPSSTNILFSPPTIKLVKKPVSPPFIKKPTNIYQSLSLESLYQDEELRRKFGISIVKEYEDTEVPIAPISFGEKTPPDCELMQYPPDSWADTSVKLTNRFGLSIPDAIVHTDMGFVSIKNHFIKESIRLWRRDLCNGRWVGPERLQATLASTTTQVEDAAYLFYGYPGNRNYAHWVVDILPSMPLGPEPHFYDDSLLLMPEMLSKWQNGYMNLVPELRQKSVFIGRNGAVHCERLKINSHAMSNSAHFPTPERMQLMQEFKSRAQALAEASTMRVYLSRKDTKARQLINEPELMELLQTFGFTIIEASKLSIPQQIMTFANAEIIVGAHGAGMANVIFCRPHTPFLELLPNTYLQWSMRRLASVVPLRYGCVIGQEVGDQSVQQQKTWRIDLDAVKKALSEVL